MSAQLLLLLLALCVCLNQLAAWPTTTIATSTGPIAHPNYEDIYGTFQASWWLDATRTTITFTIAAQTLGWVSFGICYGPLMSNNCDVALGWVSAVTPGKVVLLDMYANAYGPPKLDSTRGGTQDFVLLNATQFINSNSLTGNWTLLQFSRAVDTGDSLADNVITPGQMWFLHAYAAAPGNDTTLSFRKHVNWGIGSDLMEFIPAVGVVSPWNNNLVASWVVDPVAQLVTFNLTANTAGWLAGGLCRDGLLMIDHCDIFVAWVDDTSLASGTPVVYLLDMLGDPQNFVVPALDTSTSGCTNDYTLIAASQNSTVFPFSTNIVVQRKFDTGDANCDNVITAGDMNFIWAFGQADGNLSASSVIKQHAANSFSSTVVHFLPPVVKPSGSSSPSTTTPSPYTSSYSSADGNFQLSWGVSGSSASSLITFTVQAKATGWVAFGVCDGSSGWQSMYGYCDIQVFAVYYGQPVLYDCIINKQQVQPTINPVQNSKYLNYAQSNGNTQFTYSRVLNSGNSTNLAIGAGNTNVIWAFHASQGFSATAPLSFPIHSEAGSAVLTLVPSSGPTTSTTTTPTTGTTTPVQSSTFTSDDGSFVAKWGLDVSQTTLTVTLSARTSGWIGFGPCDNSGAWQTMKGNCDFAIVWFNSQNSQLSVFQTNSHSQSMPQQDTNSYYTAISASQSNGWTTVTVRRPLNTADPQDLAIVSGNTNVLWAWSNSGLSNLSPLTFPKHDNAGSAIIDFFTGAASSNDVVTVNRERLLKVHGAMMIAFYGFIFSAHVVYLLHKKWVQNDPFVPPSQKSYIIYSLMMHVLNIFNIIGMLLAIAANYQLQDNDSAFITDKNDADSVDWMRAAHRVSGCIVFALAWIQQSLALSFGCFKNAKLNWWFSQFHRYIGQLVMVWVVIIQAWSGIKALNDYYAYSDVQWENSTLTGVYSWFGVCTMAIFALYAYSYYAQHQQLGALENKYTRARGNNKKMISLAELSKHNQLNDLWIAVNGYVVDCTDFVKDHPGGAGVLMKFAGKDASEAWNMNHKRNFIQLYVAGLVVGVLEGHELAILDELNVEVAVHQDGVPMSTFGQKASYALQFHGPRVIIIGGGLSGLSAAHSALQSGSRVLLLDKMAFCGGNSVKATSGINGAGTRVQAALNIHDEWQNFNKDTYTSAAKGAKDAHSYELAETLTRESSDAVHWLMDHFSLNLCEVGRLGGHSAARTHRGATRFPGLMITSKLLEDLKSIAEDGSGTVEIVNKAKVTKLIRENDGSGDRVVGVEYESPSGRYSEKGDVVVIATGGWAADFGADSLLARYRPELLSLPTTNGEHCTGDGVKLAEAIGGGCIGLDWVQVHPTGLVDPNDLNAKVKTLAAEALRGADGLIFNGRGQRICNELGRRDYVTGEMQKSVGPFWLVLNSSGYHEMKWHLEHYQSMGLFKRVESGAELAAHMNVNPKVLEQTFKLYQSHAAFAHESAAPTALAAEKPLEILGLKTVYELKEEKEAADKKESPASAQTVPPTTALLVNSSEPGQQAPPRHFWEGIMPVKDPYGKPSFRYPAAWNMDSFFYVSQITPVVHYCMGGIKINKLAQVCWKGPETGDYYTSDEAHGNRPVAGLYACGEVTGGVHGKNRLGGSSLLDCVVFGRIAGHSAAVELERLAGKTAMIGVETVDTADPDLIVEANARHAADVKAKAALAAKIRSSSMVGVEDTAATTTTTSANV